MWQVRRDSCTTTKPWFIVCAWFLVIMAGKVCLSRFNGGDTLSSGQSLFSNQVMVSNNNLFELGFLATGKSDPNIYLGIWYKDFPNRTNVRVDLTNMKSVMSSHSLSVLDCFEKFKSRFFHPPKGEFNSNGCWHFSLSLENSKNSQEGCIYYII